MYVCMYVQHDVSILCTCVCMYYQINGPVLTGLSRRMLRHDCPSSDAPDDLLGPEVCLSLSFTGKHI